MNTSIPDVGRQVQNQRFGFSVRCIQSTIISGCTDPAYEEYDSSATEDNGSCQTLISSVCGDQDACNYAQSSVDYVCLEVDTFKVHTEGDLIGLTTYRLYVKFPTNYTHLVAAVFGNINTPLSVETTTNFYQDAVGGPSNQPQNPLLFPSFPDLIYDSYVTIGLTEMANSSAGESDLSLLASPNQIGSPPSTPAVAHQVATS